MVGDSAEKILAAADEVAETAVEVKLAEMGRAVGGRGGTGREEMIRLSLDGCGDFVQSPVKVREQPEGLRPGRTWRPCAEENSGEKSNPDGGAQRATGMGVGEAVELRGTLGEWVG